MKKTYWMLFTAFALALFVPLALTTGCSTAPTQRTTEVTTLKIVGASIDASMKIAADLYKKGKITPAQWAEIADLHDNKIQPAYNLAVVSVQADLSSIASTDLVNLAVQLAALIQRYQ